MIQYTEVRTEDVAFVVEGELAVGGFARIYMRAHGYLMGLGEVVIKSGGAVGESLKFYRYDDGSLYKTLPIEAVGPYPLS